MPKTDTPKPDPQTVIADALKAAGFDRANVRVSPGVHDSVITVTIPLEG